MQNQSWRSQKFEQKLQVDWILSVLLFIYVIKSDENQVLSMVRTISRKDVFATKISPKIKSDASTIQLVLFSLFGRSLFVSLLLSMLLKWHINAHFPEGVIKLEAKLG